MLAKMKILLLFTCLSGLDALVAQEIYKTTTAKVGFFSSAPIEDIQATSREGISVLNPETGELSFRLYIRTLKFPKSKMQDHFNEEFMESHKHPTATFVGKIIQPSTLPRQGEVKVLLYGDLEIHGVKKVREIPAHLNIGKEKIILKSNFDVACEDHKIKIPKILWKNIAEVVRVDVDATYKR